jgi:hypothetical protein
MPWLADLLPILALLLFLNTALLIAVYVATDRRRAHHVRMTAMPLDDGEGAGHGR